MATADEMNDGKCSSLLLLYNAKTGGRDFDSHKSAPHELCNQSVHAVTPRLPIGHLDLSINVYPRLGTAYRFYPGTARQWCEKESLLHESRAKECS